MKGGTNEETIIEKIMNTTIEKRPSAIKKFIVTLMMFVVGLFFGMGAATVAKGQNAASSLLWKVSGNGLEKPSYLFGTVHITCEDNFEMSAELKEAFEATELTVLELDMDDPNLAMDMQKHSVNPGMANISADLSEEDKEVINKFFMANYGADLTQFGVVKPFFLISMVTLKTATCATKSFEEEFVKMSKESEREVKGLETTEFQTTLFDGIPQEDQIEWLTEMINTFDQQKEMLENLMRLHKNNDLEGLYNLIIADPQFTIYADLLLYKRNQDWISKIGDIAKAQPTFFAVGAGHLPSDKGVVELLKKEGYTVEAIAY